MALADRISMNPNLNRLCPCTCYCLFHSTYNVTHDLFLCIAFLSLSFCRIFFEKKVKQGLYLLCSLLYLEARGTVSVRIVN